MNAEKTESAKAPLKNSLTQLLGELKKNKDYSKRARLIDVWPTIIGSFFSKHTTPRFIKRGVMVFVDDATMAFELTQRYKPAVLKRLQNQFGENEICDIRFVVGNAR